MAKINLLEIVNAVWLDGGVSYNILTRELNPTTGFMVSLAGHEVRHSYVDTDVVGMYIHSHRAALHKPNRYLGIWRDGTDYVFDVSEHIPEKRNALFAAITQKQIAIWDCTNKDEILVGNSEYRDLLKLKNEYDSLTEINQHTAAAKLLVDRFGTAHERMLIANIELRHNRDGEISQADYNERFEISNKYHKRLTKQYGTISQLPVES